MPYSACGRLRRLSIENQVNKASNAASDAFTSHLLVICAVLELTMRRLSYRYLTVIEDIQPRINLRDSNVASDIPHFQPSILADDDVDMVDSVVMTVMVLICAVLSWLTMRQL